MESRYFRAVKKVSNLDSRFWSQVYRRKDTISHEVDTQGRIFGWYASQKPNSWFRSTFEVYSIEETPSFSSCSLIGHVASGIWFVVDFSCL